MSNYVKTKTEILSIWNGSDAYRPVVCLTSHNISESVDEIATRTKCDSDGATQKREGAYTYEIGFDGVYSDPDGAFEGYEQLTTRLRNRGGNFTWKISTRYSDASTFDNYGSGFLSSLEKTAEIDSDVTFTGSIMGSGLITTTDPEA